MEKLTKKQMEIIATKIENINNKYQYDLKFINCEKDFEEGQALFLYEIDVVTKKDGFFRKYELFNTPQEIYKFLRAFEIFLSI